MPTLRRRSTTDAPKSDYTPNKVVDSLPAINNVSVSPELQAWQQEIVERLGIPDEVILYTGMYPEWGHRAIGYPCYYMPQSLDGTVVYDSVYRSKPLPSALEENPDLPRFVNPQTADLPNGKMPPFYIANYTDLLGQVSVSEGRIYVVEGISDVWAMFGAGAYNTVGMFSAGTDKQRVADISKALKNLGVKHVTMFPDNDHAGREHANDLAIGLQAYGFTVEIYPLPYELSINGQLCLIKDIRDLWLAHGQSAERFWETIVYCEQLGVYQHSQKVQYTDDLGYAIESAIQEVSDIYRTGENVSLFEITYKPNGWSRNLHDFIHVGNNGYAHDDDAHSPAFGYNRLKRYGRCFKCNKIYSIEEVAASLGINPKKYAIQQDTNNVSSVNLDDDSPDTLLVKELFTGNRVAKMPTAAFVRYSSELYDDYEQRLEGLTVSEHEPIPNPWPAMHHLGGGARVLQPPYMVGVLGISGGYKTSLLSAAINYYSRRRLHGIVFSPEWSPESSINRLLMQHGGLSMEENALLDLYYHEQRLVDGGMMHEQDRKRFGQMPTEQKMMNARKVLKNAKSLMRGEIAYLKSFGNNAKEILAMILRTYIEMVSNGKRPSYLIFDYAQMALPPSDERHWDTTMTISYTKALVNKLGLVCFMASQVRKEDTERLLNSEELLSSSSGNNFHDHQFNLFVTTNPMSQEPIQISHLPNSDWYLPISLAVTKSSNGRTARTRDDAPQVLVNLNRGIIIQKPKDDQRIYDFTKNPDEIMSPDQADSGEVSAIHSADLTTF